ncbi:pilus (MSHA type) biogenesis protein MshL [Thalassotalea hakodatensis]|uniref:pilus (MSHA type) biogenesis protein MshL n=1 Tax=Thalassotalea hakodatensis TaxID=3030492 RepID=UPI002572B6B6|nr:pilus (MSHA type) biogenesis protein MshL [Thalassotalea hakodatensis]
MNQPSKSMLLGAMTIFLASCQSVPPQPKHITDELDKAIASAENTKAPKPLASLPSAVQQDLMQQSMNQARQGLLSEKRLDIGASGVDAQAFFAALVEDSSYSVAVHPGVTGAITLNLKDVTLNEALDVVEQLYGYEIHQTGQVIQIYPAGIRTETIPLDYLFITRGGFSTMSVNSGGVGNADSNNGGQNNGNNNSNNNNRQNQNGNGGQNNQSAQMNVNGTNVYTENKSDFWKELEENLENLIGASDNSESSVVVSPQSGLVTVRAYPKDIKAIKRFLTGTQELLRRQVIIEAKILEVTLNDDYQQGIEWESILGSLHRGFNETAIGFSTTGNIEGNAISNTIGGVTGISFFKNTDFSGVLRLLSTQGNVQVLSSPRITATNNQKAVIKVGDDEFFVTEVSSTTTTGTATTTTPEIELTPFFSGIALDVTPQIDANGEVILHVHPSVTTVQEKTKTIRLDGQDYVLPLAQSSVRESDTVVRAKSGEIIVIGGLIETTKIDMESKTPLLGDIPLMGELFKSKSQSTQKKELVLMLKPIVTGQDTWKSQLEDARQLLKQWFPEEDTQ